MVNWRDCSSNVTIQPKLTKDYPIHPLDGPWDMNILLGNRDMDILLGYALGVLGWSVKRFENCSTKDFFLAVNVSVQMHWHQNHLNFVNTKRLAFAIAEVFAGDPNKVNDFFDLENKPISPIEDKLNALSAHFKNKI